eukprot:TRINITY_DN22226_c0_g1_i7.p1 TRINITY_DN22226_c0_g1~~TRINITY_DN22226_c0_g1_i7.p1  ORF type:complete len:146 (+),score=38.27 TRINITY_DN22226_c0_g1_i7:70-507(+)
MICFSFCSVATMILVYCYRSWFFFFFLMIRRPPRSTLSSSSAASDVYKRQVLVAVVDLAVDYDPGVLLGAVLLDFVPVVLWKLSCALRRLDVSGDVGKPVHGGRFGYPVLLSLIHISEPTRLLSISYAVFCLKKKKKKKYSKRRR